MSEYDEDIARLGPLAPVALALIEYARALDPKGQFVRKGAMWVSEPNFVAFRVPKRSREAVFSVYGGRDFRKCRALGIFWSPSRASYSEFRLTRARELAAAAFYIAQAFRLSKFKRKTAPKLDEIEEIL